MKNKKKLAVLLTGVLILLAIGVVQGYRGQQPQSGASSLDYNEEIHLIYMRQEEKLARDVYITLGALYPAYTVFSNIVISEQKHTDTMKSKLAQFNIPDPVTDDTVGVFTGEDFGLHFTDVFNLLTTWGEKGILDGLYVGAYIEELDMFDIVHCPDVIVLTDNNIGLDECGMIYTDSRALLSSYNNLLEGSKNHLRAYVKRIETFIGSGNYEAQFLSQEEVDEILGR